MHACIQTFIHICCCWFRCSGTGKRYSNRKETSCALLLKAGFEPGAPETKSPADWMLADKPTELSRIKLKLELDSPSLWSASIQPTWPHCQMTFAPGSDDIHICCCWFRCSGTGKRYSNRNETNCVPLLKAGFEPGIPDTKSPADWMLADKQTELSRIKLKTWTWQPVPMISEHSSHLVQLSVDFRTWLWRYTYLLLLISMLWHRQAIFKSKGDKLCSSAEYMIWTRGPRHQIASRLNARWQTDWAIEDQAKNLNSTSRPYDQRAFSPLDPTVSWLSYIHTDMHACMQTYIHSCCC